MSCITLLRPEVGLDLQIGHKSRQHLRILPVHLHVEDFAVEADGPKEGLKGSCLEEEAISAETA